MMAAGAGQVSGCWQPFGEGRRPAREAAGPTGENRCGPPMTRRLARFVFLSRRASGQLTEVRSARISYAPRFDVEWRITNQGPRSKTLRGKSESAKGIRYGGDRALAAALAGIRCDLRVIETAKSNGHCRTKRDVPMKSHPFTAAAGRLVTKNSLPLWVMRKRPIERPPIRSSWSPLRRWRPWGCSHGRRSLPHGRGLRRVP